MWEITKIEKNDSLSYGAWQIIGNNDWEPEISLLKVSKWRVISKFERVNVEHYDQ